MTNLIILIKLSKSKTLFGWWVAHEGYDYFDDVEKSYLRCSNCDVNDYLHGGSQMGS